MNRREQFVSMLNVTMELMNRPPLTMDAVIAWETNFRDYSIDEIRNALDGWCDSEKKAPRPADIKEAIRLSRNRKQAYQQLPPPPLTKSQNAEHSAKVQAHIAKNMKPKKDYKAWAKRIVANPERYPSISLIRAEKALAGSLASRNEVKA